MFAKPLNPLGTRDVRDPGPGESQPVQRGG